ncbi:hypothetical protein J2T17_007112 [Paenibacillus mucilaginosus]|uniref:hypothetical protein n=1 Tax=Paenibacillus mucilaginosus TaxID=61624 RepID=UPI003D2334B8
MAERIDLFFQKILGAVQGGGITIMTLGALVGVMLILIAGKNPITKRVGYVMSIAFGVSIFTVAYGPILFYYYTGGGIVSEEVRQTEEIFSSATSWLDQLFGVLLKIGTPIVVTIILIGLFVRGRGSNNPQLKRMGIGMVLFSPVVLLLFVVVPKLLQFL